MKFDWAASCVMRSGIEGRSRMREGMSDGNGYVILRRVCESETALNIMRRVPDWVAWMNGVNPSGQPAMTAGLGTGRIAASSAMRLMDVASCPSGASLGAGSAASPEKLISWFMGLSFLIVVVVDDGIFVDYGNDLIAVDPDGVAGEECGFSVFCAGKVEDFAAE